MCACCCSPFDLSQPPGPSLGTIGPCWSPMNPNRFVAVKNWPWSASSLRPSCLQQVLWHKICGKSSACVADSLWQRVRETFVEPPIHSRLSVLESCMRIFL